MIEWWFGIGVGGIGGRGGGGEGVRGYRRALPAPGHCRWGHRLGEGDYYWSGYWRCRECSRAYGRAHYVERREGRRAARAARYIAAWEGKG